MKRNYGIDLLRMILMFMVVMLHVLGNGGILRTADAQSVNYYLAWIIECICYCAVNCYALITGYVHYNSKYRISSLLMIWTQTLIYTISISMIIGIISGKPLSLGYLLNAFFVSSGNPLWYVPAYTGLFILIPMLNNAVNASTIAQAKRFLLVSSIAFTLIPTFVRKDPFYQVDGYSTIWLMYLYLVGAFIHKNKWDTVLSKRKLMLLFFISVFVTVFFKFTTEKITTAIFGEAKGENLFISYVSPTIFMASIALLLTFVKVNPIPVASKIIGLLSPAAFGVYLIHCQPNIFSFCNGKFAFLANSHPLIMVIGVFGCSLGIYVPCLFIDLLRHILFKKLHVKEFLEKLETTFFMVDVEAHV